MKNERKKTLKQHILREKEIIFISPITSCQAQDVIRVERVDNSNAS